MPAFHQSLHPSRGQALVAHKFKLPSREAAIIMSARDNIGFAVAIKIREDGIAQVIQDRVALHRKGPVALAHEQLSRDGKTLPGYN